MLQKKDGLALLRSSLVAERPAGTRMLHRALRKAISHPGHGEPVESPFMLERRLATSAWIVRVMPGPGLDCWEPGGQRTALLKLYDRDPDLVVDEKALVSIYGLTRGEAALAAKVVQGKSIESAADELCISPHTARTHLKRIFMKTDTHRQPELVVRILTMAW
jgi:DNA-binding CsgD family transcriptional regulator